MESNSETGERTRKRVRRGYERLAYGGVADAVKLLFTEEPDLAALDKMDLYNIAEIKRPKGGGMEIKFFDRIKALQSLEELSGTGGDSLPLYRTLQECARSFGEDANGV